MFLKMRANVRTNGRPIFFQKKKKNQAQQHFPRPIENTNTVERAPWNLIKSDSNDAFIWVKQISFWSYILILLSAFCYFFPFINDIDFQTKTDFSILMMDFVLGFSDFLFLGENKRFFDFLVGFCTWIFRFSDFFCRQM